MLESLNNSSAIVYLHHVQPTVADRAVASICNDFLFPHDRVVLACSYEITLLKLKLKFGF